MPEVLPGHVPSPRTLLAWDGTAYRPITINAAGQVEVDVALSTVAGGIATAANQATEITALQLIDDLRAALESVATDRLIVRGENQLFSMKGVLALYRSAVISGADGYIDSNSVPAGEYWIVTTIMGGDATTAPTMMRLWNRHDGVAVCIHEEIKAFAIAERTEWAGHTCLDQGDNIRIGCIGGLAGDTCFIEISGYRMTPET